MNRNVRDTLLGITALALFAFCIKHQSDYLEDWSQGSGKYTQKVNIPNRETIQLLAMGYDNFYADLMTIRAVQMFGSAWATENKDPEPIYNYFDVLTDLDPYFIDVYELSNIVLSDDFAFREGRPDAHAYSIRILRKGITYNPQSHRVPYLAMYTAIWNMKNDDLARSFLPVLERIPDTPDHILRLEEYIERQSGRYQIAYDVNLKHFLQYSEQGKKHETEIAWNKFLTIIDGWNKLEMARAADGYRKDFGQHPDSLEQLMDMEYLTTYEIASLQSTYENIIKYQDEPNFSEFAEDIRDASIQIVEGVPADPNGYWYYLNTFVRDNSPEIENLENNENAPLVDRYAYIVSAKEQLDHINRVSAESQGIIMTWINDYDVPPIEQEMAHRLGPDYIGGHYVYLEGIADEEGTVLPRYFSTANLRIISNLEPRMGFSGTVDDLPKRTNPTVDGLPDYLTTQPSIWDFEEDALWALCVGLEPGLRAGDHSEEYRMSLSNTDDFIPCNDHIDLRDLDPTYVPYQGDIGPSQ